VYGSIQQWVNVPSLSTGRRCRVYNNSYTQFVDYIDLPKIVAFKLRDKTIVLNAIVSVRQLIGTDFNYRLAGIVYFGVLACFLCLEMERGCREFQTQRTQLYGHVLCVWNGGGKRGKSVMYEKKNIKINKWQAYLVHSAPFLFTSGLSSCIMPYRVSQFL